jgi:hypothetical protein
VSHATKAAAANRFKLSSEDFRQLRTYYFDILPKTSRSTVGASLQHAHNAGRVMRGGEEVPLSRAYPTPPTPKVVNGKLVRSELEVTARPSKPHGDQSGTGGYVLTNAEMTISAFVMAQFYRLERVRIGEMQLDARKVFEEFLTRSAEGDDLSYETCNCDAVAHLTAPFAGLAIQVKQQAREAAARACHRYNLKGKEAAFVCAVDVSPLPEKGEPDNRVGRHHAAIAAGYDAATAHEKADELSAKAPIAEAIKMREKADAIMRLSGDWALMLELRRRRAVGDLVPSQKEQLRAAEHCGRELMRLACAAWNVAKVGGIAALVAEMSSPMPAGTTTGKFGR